MTDRQPTSVAFTPTARSVSELLQDTATHTEDYVAPWLATAIVGLGTAMLAGGLLLVSLRQTGASA